MKKVFVLFTVIAFAMNVALAQEATKAKPAKDSKNQVKAETRPVKAEKLEKEKVKKEEVEKEEAPQSADGGAKATAAPLKKDGTPDMRYKENKEAKVVEGPKKKDGTPDMRYKENKETKKEVKK